MANGQSAGKRRNPSDLDSEGVGIEDAPPTKDFASQVYDLAHSEREGGIGQQVSALAHARNAARKATGEGFGQRREFRQRIADRIRRNVRGTLG